MEHVKLIEDVRIVVTVHNSGKCTVTYYLPLGMFGDDFVKFKIRNKEEIEKLKQYEKEADIIWMIDRNFGSQVYCICLDRIGCVVQIFNI